MFRGKPRRVLKWACNPDRLRVTCAWLMRTRWQMTHWYDKLEGKLGRRARILDAKYKLLASFLLAFGHLPAFRNSKKKQDDLFVKPAGNFRQLSLFPVLRQKVVCPVNFVSSKSTRLLSHYTCLFFTFFTSRRLIITMQASDAEVVILEDSLINLNFVDLAFVGGSSKQFMSALSSVWLNLCYVVPVMHGTVGNRRRQFLPLYLWIPGKYMSKRCSSKLFSWKTSCGG